MASITASGLANAGSPGTATLSATLGDHQAMAQFTVTSATLTGLTVETGTTLAKGLSRQLVARGTFSDGTTQDLSQNVEWSSSDPSIVSVGSTGLAQAEREGRATLSASAAGVSATGELTVTKATLQSLTLSPLNPTLILGASAQFTARGTYSDGTERDLTELVTWSSATSTVASISSGGFAHALGLGSSVISAKTEGLTDSTTLTVMAGGGGGPSGPPTLLNLSVAEGSEGDILTLTGTNFVAGATVNFGATPAISVNVVPPTQITATVPKGPGTLTVPVTVTTANGTSNSLDFLYDFVISDAITFNTDQGTLDGVPAPGWDSANKVWNIPAGFRVAAQLNVFGDAPFQVTSNHRIRVEALINARGGAGGNSIGVNVGDAGQRGPGGWGGDNGPGFGETGLTGLMSGSGGGGGGHANNGSSGQPADANSGGAGGLAYGDIAPPPPPLSGGSGGGRGGNSATGAGGGGGGGGGGVVSLTTTSTLTVSGDGRIDCSGGAGGNGSNNAGGGGGGGAGGAIFLTAGSSPVVAADPAPETPRLDVRGGAGGVAPPSSVPGGAGSVGRVVLSPSS